MGKKLLISLVVAASLLLAGCSKTVTAVPTAEPTQSIPTVVSTSTPAPTAQPTSFVEVGPEATPPAIVSYPTSLSVEEIQPLLGAGGTLPEGFSQDPGVSALVDTRLTWFRLAGLNVDDTNRTDYVTASIIAWGQGDSFRWDVIPKDQSGNIVGWLQIHDETMETGWRFAETPSWDPGFDPSVEQFKFDLPEKLFPENLFEVILVRGEYKVLVEIDDGGNPLRWLDVAQQEMGFVQGVELPEQYRLSGSGIPERLVDGQWQEIELPKIPESLQSEVILSPDGLPQIKVQLTNFDTPDGLVIGEYADGEWNPVPFAFIRSPETTKEILGMYTNYFREEGKRNPVNSFVEYRITGVLQGMRLEVDEESSETHLTMLMIFRDRVMKLVADVNAIRDSAHPEAEQYDSLSLTFEQIAILIGIPDRQLIKARFFDEPSQRVYMQALFYIVTDQVTEFYCGGYNIQLPGFQDFCYENVGNEDREIQTLAGFESLLYRERLRLTPEMVDSGIDWWDDTLIKTISKRVYQVYVGAGFADLTEMEY